MLEPFSDDPLVPAMGRTGDVPCHKMGGSPNEEAPPCPNCRLQMTRFFELSRIDPALGRLRAFPSDVELLYCWQCAIPSRPFHYRYSNGGRVEYLAHGAGGMGPLFPYERYPRVFPQRSMRLRPMRRKLGLHLAEYTRLIAQGREEAAWELTNKHKSLNVPRHQFGGLPFLYDYREFRCLCCGRPMMFLATVADQSTDPRGFVGNPFVQVVYYSCIECLVIGARHECD